MLPHVIKLGENLELLDRHKKLSLTEEKKGGVLKTKPLVE